MKISRNRVRASLIAQMKAKGMTGDHFMDLADDYMALWDRKTELERDLKERGLKVAIPGPKGRETIRTNESLMDSLKVNKAMNDMLKNLGLNEPDGAGADNDL